MGNLKVFLAGILFGITLAKAEVISWYRIYEMFRFESFHMYGIIGSAVILGVVIIQYIKRTKMKSIDGEEITIKPKPFNLKSALIGGVFFGLGWAMIGACPGPMFILAGFGAYSILIAIAGALLGTLAYGMLRRYLPH